MGTVLEHVYVYNVFITGQINSPISLNMAESNPVSVAYPYRRCQAAFGIYAAKAWVDFHKWIPKAGRFLCVWVFHIRVKQRLELNMKLTQKWVCMWEYDSSSSLHEQCCSTISILHPCPVILMSTLIPVNRDQVCVTVFPLVWHSLLDSFYRQLLIESAGFPHCLNCLSLILSLTLSVLLHSAASH